MMSVFSYATGWFPVSGKNREEIHDRVSAALVDQVEDPGDFTVFVGREVDERHIFEVQILPNLKCIGKFESHRVLEIVVGALMKCEIGLSWHLRYLQDRYKAALRVVTSPARGECFEGVVLPNYAAALDTIEAGIESCRSGDTRGAFRALHNVLHWADKTRAAMILQEERLNSSLPGCSFIVAPGDSEGS